MRPVYLPETLEALWPILTEEPQALLFAGGTDLLVKMRLKMVDPTALIGLERIQILKGVEDRSREIFIRAATPHAALLADPLVQTHFPVLIQALQVLGSPQIRHMGTIGGNLVTASPAGDCLPPLYVLGASVELRTANSLRRLPIQDFVTGPGKTRLQPGEILTGIAIDKQPELTLHHFEKIGQRRALAIAVVSLAAVLEVDDSGRVQKARLAWGSVGPAVVLCREAEAVLEGNRLSLEELEKAAALARRAVTPIDDVRAGADYRRVAAGNLLHRLLTVKERCKV
jgi:CO/xanthine dehydrogenase FAD-binding subunit